ncbi:MAG: helix-turn-helix domain-containing protein [Mycobacteriales bacterium]
MTTLEEQVTALARRLSYASEDDELAIEAAVLAAASDAQRTRPANLPAYVRSQTPEQVAEVRATTLRDWLATRDEMVASSLSTAQVAERLGISSAAVTKRRQARRLVAFQVKGDWRYPAWQLRQGGVGGEVLDGVAATWQALPLEVHDLLGLARWFTLESRHLGTTPLALLEAGEVARVVDAAGYVGGT